MSFTDTPFLVLLAIVWPLWLLTGRNYRVAATLLLTASVVFYGYHQHWLLVLPMPNKIWDWGLKSRGALRPAEVEVVAGFLGAGKTTFLRRMLAEADPNVRTVVLVNDFGANQRFAQADFVGQCVDRSFLQTVTDRLDGRPLKGLQFKRNRHGRLAAARAAMDRPPRSATARSPVLDVRASRTGRSPIDRLRCMGHVGASTLRMSLRAPGAVAVQRVSRRTTAVRRARLDRRRPASSRP